MKATVRCVECGRQQIIADVDSLVALTCPACGATAEARASEDFASAVEDALAQLWHISQRFELELRLDTAELPESFRPPASNPDL